MWPNIFKPTRYELVYKPPFYGKLKRFNHNTQTGAKCLAIARKFGAFMAGMVLPAIGVLIGWGLFTAIILGIKTAIAYQHNILIKDWSANESATYLFYMDKVVDLGIQFSIPLIIAFFGGRQVYEQRGALVGFAGVLGVIVYSQISLQSNINTLDALTYKWTFNALMVQITKDVSLINTSPSPMILGALIAGPLLAWVFKSFEKLYKNKIKQGFEMLVNNFSLGVFACVAIFACFWIIGPLMALFQVVFFFIIQAINNAGLLFVLPVFVELEKILFLNNAVNHGILGPLGYQAAATGYSPLFYLDPNPGQGLGLLLAYFVFGNKEQKSQATAALPIHFVGGIHEVYYPFVLLNPVNLLFMIAGGVFAGSMYQIFDFGGIFTPSPGSIIMNYLAVYSAKPLNYLALTIAVFGAMAIVFVLTALGLLWLNIKNGQRIILNPLKIRLMKMVSKAQTFASVNEINLMRQVKDVSYLQVTDKHNFWWEIITFKNKSQEFFIIKPNAKRIVDFCYKVYGKEKYCEKFYTKPGFDLTKRKAKRCKTNQRLAAMIKVMLQKHASKIAAIAAQKATILTQYPDLAVAFDAKIEQINNKYNKKIDALRFKITKSNYYKGKRIKLKANQSEIHKICYEQKPVAFWQRTIVFVDNLAQKKQDQYAKQKIKQEYAKQLRKLKTSDASIKAHLKVHFISQIQTLSKKRYYKNQIDLIDITAKHETLQTIKTPVIKSKPSSINQVLDMFVQKKAKIIFACEAGVGSSAMGAGLIKKMLTNLGINDWKVTNCAIKDLPQDLAIIITQKTFFDFIAQNHPNAYIYPINQFLQKQEYQTLIDVILKYHSTI